MKVKIEVSARHIHLCAKDCMTLFGTTELTKRNDLSEIGEYASDQTVEIVGPNKRMHNVRVLGPLREKSQLELARSDALFIGVDAPLALSGEGKGCEIKVIGPKGSIQSNIAMVAKRHFHLSPKTAEKLKLKNNSIVKTRIYGDRAAILENIIVRIADNFIDNIHVDTDEGNACGINKIIDGELIL